MNLHHALVLLTTETPLHVGTGQSIAGLDLPIQRETHTQWPCIFGSSVKGALRSHADIRVALDSDKILSLFGPAQNSNAGERDSAHAGSLMVGDAKILLLPVRSLQSSFKWVTCPTVLDRFYRDNERLDTGLNQQRFQVDNDANAIGKDNQVLFLEEFRLEQQAVQSESFNALCQQIIKLTGRAEASRFKDIENKLVIVSDDVFTFLAKNATTVNAHIAIDSKTKAVTQGALWYEESLPPDSLFYFPLTTTRSRKKGYELSATEMLNVFKNELFKPSNSWLQIGGNETTGMGWCRIDIQTAQGTED